MEADGEVVLDGRELALLSSVPEAEHPALRHLIGLARSRGHVTHAEVSAALPSDQLSSDRIEDALAVLAAMGVEVTEDDGSEAEAVEKVATADAEDEATGNVKEDAGSNVDPVRMYLRDMGAVVLLSREGEIAIAKRIEAGRSMMIEGLCEAPMVLDAILGWYRAVQDGRMLLRDVLDLGATASAGEGPADGTPDHEDNNAGGEAEGGAVVPPSVLEQQVRPEAMAAFEAFDAAAEPLRELQARRMAAYAQGEALAKAEEANFARLRAVLVGLVGGIYLHEGRVAELVDRLRQVNKRLTGAQGRLLRIAETAGVKRGDFLAVPSLRRFSGLDDEPRFPEGQGLGGPYHAVRR